MPLLTFFIATGMGLERFHWRGVVGGGVAVAGVAVVFADQLREVPLGSLLALIATAASIAASTVLVKVLPRADPVATNAVAMVPGAALLFALSFVAREPTILPALPATWLALVYLILSSMVLFVGFFFVVRRWTASATSYATVLFPIVTVALGALLAGELVSLTLVAGGALVMVGTYVGALAAVAPRAVPATAGD